MTPPPIFFFYRKITQPLQNCIGPTIRIGREILRFLDTICNIKEGRIETNLYRKQTDRNQYALPSSCHPRQTTKSISYSLGLIIFSEQTNRDNRLEELKVLLKKRRYKEETIDTSLSRAKRVPRELALRRVAKPNQPQRPVFAVTYDPRLPSIGSLQAKYWRSMKSKDQNLDNVLPSPHSLHFVGSQI